MRKSESTLSAAIAVVLAIVPHLAKAGPCTTDIAELQRTIQQPGVEVLDAARGPSISVQPGRSLTRARQLDEHSWPQFSATIARAKRLDVYGDRLGCSGALNAARAMYVLVARD